MLIATSAFIAIIALVIGIILYSRMSEWNINTDTNRSYPPYAGLCALSLFVAICACMMIYAIMFIIPKAHASSNINDRGTAEITFTFRADRLLKIDNETWDGSDIQLPKTAETATTGTVSVSDKPILFIQNGTATTYIDKANNRAFADGSSSTTLAPATLFDGIEGTYTASHMPNGAVAISVHITVSQLISMKKHQHPDQKTTTFDKTIILSSDHPGHSEIHRSAGDREIFMTFTRKVS